MEPASSLLFGTAAVASRITRSFDAGLRCPRNVVVVGCASS